ncbi:glycoside hydrolase family 36 protein [Rubellicoccus peritrichatus]|uniref:Alpha-galactosidase n=1 Tax=Rubellicoccus peritrichatus TaxID=3080537 RepID=A0AAQ3LBM3_9BACT|nr:glycoside hydrolase family 36 protein [Puniceicoccus sp. CR14]WOO41377.1 alpha-galactosidase [Puniceicoccus sp. CR14]
MAPHIDSISPVLHPFGSICSRGSGQEFCVDSGVREVSPGLTEYTLDIRFAKKCVPAPMVIEWFVPLIDITGKWHPLIGSDRSLTSGWCEYIKSYATMGAPVFSLYSEQGENRHTFALSDAINPIGTRVQVEEDTAEVKCTIVLFDAPTPELEHYSITIRKDERRIPYHQSLAGVGSWWESMDDYLPTPVPDAAFDPVYSSWYSFHQNLTPEGIENNCKWARELGCKTLILDDGWQTDDSKKGYDFCGDWEIAETKFPDFSGHVDRVHSMDMRYLLWFSVPYAGVKSAAWKIFQDRVLPKARRNADCLDPRYPQVRRYLIDLYKRAIGDWKLDGLKLDFVDQFTAEHIGESYQEQPDMVSVPAAADRLLADMMTELRAINPEVLTEFRQRYIGPAMRKYGNIFRAQDCPNDALSNRVRTIDIRLLAGDTAVHSDMIMWNRSDSVERAALQLWAIFFSVPQISVEVDAVTDDQDKMLRFVLGFWLEHRDLLMRGHFKPCMPQYLYPIVFVEDDAEVFGIVYQNDLVVSVTELRDRKLTLVNATELDRVIVDFGKGRRGVALTTCDCMGNVAEPGEPDSVEGITAIQVPPSGILMVQPESVISM